MRRLDLVGLVATTACAMACSSPDSGNGDNPFGGSGAGNGGSAASSGGGLGGAISGGGSSGGFQDTQTREDPNGNEATCAATVVQGETVPVDMFVMMDRSGSMLGGSGGLFGGGGPNVWIPIGSAVGDFVALPEAAGLGIGIQFYPLGNDSCDVNLYAQPAAPIAALPGNAAAIQQAIVNNGPVSGGATPTLPAMQGAVQHATQHALANPGTKTIVILATDGEPNVCNSTIDGVAQVARAAATGTPSIETYVIGIGNVGGLNTIAAAGDPAGQRTAQIVDTDPAVASAQFLQAMNEIRGDASLPCEYQLPIPPEGEELDYDKVNVTFSQGSSASELFYVPDQAECDPTDGGWYYDDPGAPSSIRICAATCTVLEAVTDGQIDVELGCARRDRPVQ